MGVIYNHAFLSLICFWIFNMIITRYVRDCRMFVFKLNDDSFLDLTYPMMLTTAVFEALVQFMGFQSLVWTRDLFMNISMGMIACRLIIGKMSRQLRSDIAEASRKHIEIRECTEGELRSIRANTDAWLDQLRKKVEGVQPSSTIIPSKDLEVKDDSLTKPSFMDYPLYKHPGFVPIFIKACPEPVRRIILLEKSIWDRFKTDMMHRSGDDPLYTNPNGPIIIPIQSTYMFPVRLYEQVVVEEGERKGGVNGELHVTGYRWNPMGYWEDEHIHVAHTQYATETQIQMALYFYLQNNHAHTNISCMDELVTVYRKVIDMVEHGRDYGVYNPPDRAEKTGITLVGVEETYELIAVDGCIQFFISKNQRYDDILMLPNGWWNAFKDRMTRGVYQNSAIYNGDYGPIVFPTYGPDTFAEKEFNYVIESGDYPAQGGQLTIYGYKWNSVLHTWDHKSLMVHFYGEGTELDICKALYRHILHMMPVHGKLNTESDLVRVYQSLEKRLRETVIRTPTQEVMAPPTSKKVEADLHNCFICDTYGGIEVLIPGLDKHLIPMEKSCVERIIRPCITAILKGLNTGRKAISAHFDEMAFIEVRSNSCLPVLDFRVETENGYNEQLFTWPANPDLQSEGPLVSIMECMEFGDVGFQFITTQQSTLITSKNSVLSREDVERIFANRIREIPNDRITDFLTLAIEHVPFFGPRTAPDGKQWTVSLITSECFNQLKTNVGILREHYFVDETGKPYPFVGGDGHEDFYDILRNRLWLVVSDKDSTDFELNSDACRWFVREGEYKDKEVRITSFKAYRLTFQSNWAEEWQPFGYEVGTMDGMALRIAILNACRFPAKQPTCYTKLSEILHFLLPESYYDYHNSVEKDSAGK